MSRSCRPCTRRTHTATFGAGSTTSRIKSQGMKNRKRKKSPKSKRKMNDRWVRRRRYQRGDSTLVAVCPDGLRSVVPSAPAVGGLPSAPRMKRSASLRAPGYNDRRLPSVTARLPDIQLRTKRAAPPPMFVFGERERRLNHSRTKPSGYHVLQKCDKAQQLRALAPPPPGAFFPLLLPSLDLLSRVAPPPFNPFRDVTVDLPRSTHRPCSGPPSLKFRCGDFKWERI